jgi:V-type ATPase 116kDa subunit family
MSLVKAPRLFRSEDMELLQLVISHDVAHDTVDALGHLGVLQFKDLNPDVNALQRNFVAEVKRLDDMERKLAFLEQQVGARPLCVCVCCVCCVCVLCVLLLDHWTACDFPVVCVCVCVCVLLRGRRGV